jgi:hypothetical protein
MTSGEASPSSSAADPRDPVFAVTIGEPDAVMLPCALPFRESPITWSKNHLSVELPNHDLFDATQRARIADGLSVSVAVRVYAFDRPIDRPIALAARTCRLAYDLWDRVYRINVDGQPIKAVHVALDGAMRTCLRALDVIDRSAIGPTPVVLAAIVDVGAPAPLFAEILGVAKSGFGAPPVTGPLAGDFSSLFCAPRPSLRFRTQAVLP